MVKGYTNFPLTLIVMNKALSKVDIKVQQRLLFMYLSLLGMILRKESFQSILLSNRDKILFTWDLVLFFLNKIR